MGTNNNPYSGQSLVNIEARPNEHEAVIERQGQLVKLLQAKKCPCITHGKPKLFCSLCNGRGYKFYFQEKYMVIEENSPHGLCDDLSKIYPFYTPIVNVRKVERITKTCQLNITDYNVASFDDESIMLTAGQDFPKRYEHIKVTYDYKIPNSVTDENSTSDGTYIIHTTGTEMQSTARLSNPFGVHGDIISVSRVRNVTQAIDYNVLSFAKQSITLDSESGAKPAPLSNDVLEVDYEYVLPIKAIIGRLKLQNSLLKWGEDIKQSDIEATFPGGYYIKRGNVVVLLTAFVTESVIIKRGAGTKDELPFFEVYEILEDIEDEDGTIYTKDIDFKLSEYNDLVWIGSSPNNGKKFSVVLRYHPSYTVYKDEMNTTNAEDKRFPKTVLLRIFKKFGIKELDIS